MRFTGFSVFFAGLFLVGVAASSSASPLDDPMACPSLLVPGSFVASEDWFREIKTMIRAARDRHAGVPCITPEQAKAFFALVKVSNETADVSYLKTYIQTVYENPTFKDNPYLQKSVHQIMHHVLAHEDIYSADDPMGIYKISRKLIAQLPVLHTEVELANFLRRKKVPEKKIRDLFWNYQSHMKESAVISEVGWEARASPLESFILASLFGNEEKIHAVLEPKAPKPNNALEILLHVPTPTTEVKPQKKLANEEVIREEAYEKKQEALTSLLPRLSSIQKNMIRRSNIATRVGTLAPVLYVPLSMQEGSLISALVIHLDHFNPTLFFFQYVRASTYGMYFDSLPKDQEALILAAVFEYFSIHAPTEQERELARVYSGLQKDLLVAGYTLAPENEAVGEVTIHNLPSRPEIEKSRTAFGGNGRFFWDPNWMTQWADVPAPVRTALLKNFPEKLFVEEATTRVRKELAQFATVHYQFEGRYNGFVEDWLLIPAGIRSQAEAKLSAKEKTAWQIVVDSQRDSNPNRRSN